MEKIVIFVFLIFLTACHEQTVELSSDEDEIVLPIIKISQKDLKESIDDKNHLDVHTFTGGKITDGLDIKRIRSSQTNLHTRLIFDSYISDKTALQSGKYTFTYIPSKKQISAVIHGYRKFSAILPNRTYTFSKTSIIKNIKMETYMDDSGFKFSINLYKDASVNVFELKSPARIVVDITSN